MEKKKDKGKVTGKKNIQHTGSVAQYSNSSFFKKKDDTAKKFLEKHPIPSSFWE